MLDYIIVGQGIAGTLMAERLIRAGKKIVIVDQGHESASSRVAAGLVNPITGRRFVKSWLVDKLIPFAKEYYQAREQELEIDIYDERNVAMLFSSIKMLNDWMLRSGDEDIKAYLAEEFNLPTYEQALNEVVGGVRFENSARVRIGTFISAYRQKWKGEEVLIEEAFDYHSLKVEDNQVRYKELTTRRILFCEGAQAVHNPYFNYLPFWPAKGEVLWVRIPNYSQELKQELVKHGVFIVHLKEDIFWVGSSFNRKFETAAPSQKERVDLEKRLREVLKFPFEVIDHLAAVRPTVKDRKPFLGQHPRLDKLFIFNGLGAKGSYLGPYFSAQMYAFLEKGDDLDAIVNIQRYVKLYTLNS